MHIPRVVVGIDFGTYGSGIALLIGKNAIGAGEVKPTLLTAWPGQTVESPKNLTALLVEGEQDVAGWGYEARFHALTQRPAADAPQYFTGFKMGLMHHPAPKAALAELQEEQASNDSGGDIDGEDEQEVGETEVAPAQPDAGAIVAGVGDEQVEGEVQLWTSVDLKDLPRRERSEALITLYLQRLYLKALEETQRWGYGPDDIRWCITVPAIWTDEQKQAMRDCAIRAGLPAEDGRLILALEPEAAAHYARTSGVNVPGEQGHGDSDLETPGCVYVVVDCGGGTVDLTSYKNDAEGHMVEAGVPSGGPYGAEEINRAFRERVLVDRFGKADIVDMLEQKCPEAFLDLCEQWERSKLDFTADRTTPFFLNIPAAIDRALGAAVRKRLARKQEGTTDKIVVTVREAAELFDTVVPEILDLIDGQLKNAENMAAADSPRPLILLVGGFAASRYLQSAVTSHIGERARVLVPPDPAAAVLHGAALFAYEPRIRARRSRLTYGVSIAAEFEEGVDPEELVFVDSFGVKRCRNRFSKIVTRGDLIDTDEDSHGVYNPIEPTCAELAMRMYSSTEDDPRYVTDAGCQRIGHIEVDLSKVMEFAHKDRGVDLYLRFGETQIKARAVVKKSGEEVSTAIRFTSEY
ncbi:Hsp70 family protein [Streptomyces sp. NPDC053792]|uniref:Hsp70 family protein n=1 Tax=Streptomyces sp. NPDC053792 TaxID=3365716 RepID=UPI0037D1DE1C